MLGRFLWLGLVAMTVGCGTARFNVPVDEVRRLAELPVGERGQQVRVIPGQDPATAVPPGPEAPVYAQSDVDGPNLVAEIALDLPLHPGHAHGGRPRARLPVAPGPIAPSRSLPGSAGAGGFRGTPTPRPQNMGVGAFRGTPVPSGAGPAAASFRGTPRPAAPKVPPSSGGSSSADGGTAVAVLLMAVVVIPIIIYVIAEASAEAEQRAQFARTFDGWVTVDPGHILHLHYANNVSRKVPLGALRPQDTVGLRHAYMEDDANERGKVVPLGARPEWSPPPPPPPPPPRVVPPLPPGPRPPSTPIPHHPALVS